MTTPPNFWISLAITCAAFLLRARIIAIGSAFQVTSISDAEKETEPLPPKALLAFQKLKSTPERAAVTVQTAALILTLIGAPAAFSSIYQLVLDNARSCVGFVCQKPDFLMLASAALAGFAFTAAAAVFPELFMRALSQSAPVSTAVKGARAIAAADLILTPFSKIFGGAVKLCLKPFGLRPKFRTPKPSMEDLERLLSEAARRSDVSRQAPRLIHNIFEMNDRIARDIIVPRTQVLALDAATPPMEIVKILAERGHSRIPVYRGEIDNIVGVLHARDLIPMLHCPELIVIEDVIRPAFFVPWSKPVGDLLRVLQKKHVHMAIVVDEYGGFLGVATLEDLLETIVGEIRNEYTVEGPAEIEEMGDGSFRVRGEASVEQVEKRMNVKFACEEPCETMSGLVSYLSGSIPETGERIFVSGCLLIIEERSERKVTRIRCQRVSLPPEEVRKQAPVPKTSQGDLSEQSSQMKG